MRAALRFIPVLTLFACSPGCGGDASVEPSGGAGGSTSSATTGTSASSGTTGSTSTSGAGGAGGGAESGCPVGEPVAAGACSTEGLRCSYGDSVVPACRRGYRCQEGAWQADGGGCGDGPPDCGITDPQGATCDVQSALCVSGTSFCVCGPCGGAGCPDPPWGWSCAGVSGDPSCPAVIPNDGTACSVEGADCFYGVMCASDRSITCVGGTWVWAEEMACP